MYQKNIWMIPILFSYGNFIFKMLFSLLCRVFVNRSLHLENIKYYGFDMDYTLAGW